MYLRTLVLGGGNKVNVNLTPTFGLTKLLEKLDLGGNEVASTPPDTFGYNWKNLVYLKLVNSQVSRTLQTGLLGLTSLSKCSFAESHLVSCEPRLTQILLCIQSLLSYKTMT